MTVSLTVLNHMASRDISEALDRHLEWGLKFVDLREGIFGKKIAELNLSEAKKVARLVTARGLQVHCLSTSVFYTTIESGPDAWRNDHLTQIDNVVNLAEILEPTYIRLMAAQMTEREKIQDSVAYIEKVHPWVIGMYQTAIERIASAGCQTLIENEAHRCFLRDPQEFLDFFAILGHQSYLGLTWDVVNHWSSGVFPTLEVYETLRNLIRYYHVKGGRDEDGNQRLTWNTSLEDATWPVVAITQRVVSDALTSVICVNPPQHGRHIPEYDYEDVTQADLRFLRHHVQGIA